MKNVGYLLLWSVIFTQSTSCASGKEVVDPQVTKPVYTGYVNWYRKEFPLSTDSSSDISEIKQMEAQEFQRTLNCIAKLQGYAGYRVVREPNFKILSGFTGASHVSIAKCTSHKFFEIETEIENVSHTAEELDETLFLLSDNISTHGLIIESSLKEGKVLVHSPVDRISELEQVIVSLNISDKVLLLERETPLGYSSDGTGTYEVVSIILPAEGTSLPSEPQKTTKPTFCPTGTIPTETGGCLVVTPEQNLQINK